MLGAVKTNFIGRDVVRNRYGYPFNPSGKTVISTTTDKFGDSSVFFPGWPNATFLQTTVDHTIIPDDSNWTVEGFWRPSFSNLNGYTTIISFAGVHGVSLRGFNTPGSAVIEYYFVDKNGGNAVNWNGNANGASGSYDTSTWYHWAVVHNNNEFYIYGNGTRTSSRSGYTANYNVFQTSTTTNNIAIGGSSNQYFGYMDEIRISKTARYTGGTLVVPTAEFTHDANTVFLMKFEGIDGSQNFIDTSS
jgi:hypothetical protein